MPRAHQRAVRCDTRSRAYSIWSRRPSCRLRSVVFNRRNGSVSCDRREQAAVPLRYDRTGRPASRMSVGEASDSEWASTRCRIARLSAAIARRGAGTWAADERDVRGDPQADPQFADRGSTREGGREPIARPRVGRCGTARHAEHDRSRWRRSFDGERPRFNSRPAGRSRNRRGTRRRAAPCRRDRRATSARAA